MYLCVYNNKRSRTAIIIQPVHANVLAAAEMVTVVVAADANIKDAIQ